MPEMPRPKRQPEKPVQRTARRPAEPPVSTRAHDTPEFVERVQAVARRKLGGRIEEVVTDPAIREIAYNAIASGLRQPSGPVAPEIAALAGRLAERGIVLTPGSGDVRDLPVPLNIPGVSLSEAVIEGRYSGGARRVAKQRMPMSGVPDRDRDRRTSHDHPVPCTPEFRQRVDAAARAALGAPIDEIVPPGDLRDVLYEVFAKGLRRKPRPISPETLELVEHLRAQGLVATPGAGPAYLRKPLRARGSLTDALLEERYGTTEHS